MNRRSARGPRTLCDKCCSIKSERLTRLVNNVLELSKLERHDRSLSVAAGPLLPILEEAREVVTPHAAGEGFAIRLDVDYNCYLH